MRPNQRRGYFRLDASIEPDWARRLTSSAEIPDAIEARIIDISGGGLRLRTPEMLRENERIGVRFRLGDEKFDLPGRVMWTEGSRFTGETLVGLRFDSLDDVTRERLVRHIHQNQLSGIRRPGR